MIISTLFHPLPPVARFYITSEPKQFPLFTPLGTRSLESPPRCRRLNRTFTLLPAVSGSGSAGGDGDTFTENSGYLFELSQSDAESITEYDIVKIGSIYRRKPLILVRRLFQISTTLGKWFILRYIDGVKERADSMFKIRAAQLRKILVELGPAYVKIAQAVSSRADLIPQSYLDELSILQDRIAPFSNEVAFKTIEQELGLEIDELFSEISLDPVAAASLGQVYQARLRSSGQMVAVKVQRPGVQAVISLDILILRFLVGLLRKAGKFNTDLQGVLDEWASSLFRQFQQLNKCMEVQGTTLTQQMEAHKDRVEGMVRRAVQTRGHVTPRLEYEGHNLEREQRRPNAHYARR